MRGVEIAAVQLLAAAVGIAAISGLIGFAVVHFEHWGGSAAGFGWGMAIGGAVVGFAAGGSGSPTENLVRGRMGFFATYWGESSPLPQSPLQLALGGLFAFAGGLALLILA